MERTRPEFVGALGVGVDIPNEPEVAGVSRSLLASDGPVRFDPESDCALPSGLAERFDVKSIIAIAVHPKVDKPYAFGLHQCSFPRVWTPHEERLFHESGRRLAGALDTLLMFRNLRESQRKLEASRAELAASRARIVTAADETRLPEPVERAAYYVVSEALTNTAKHAHASMVRVAVEARDGVLGLSIRDDGCGGADPTRGSGLMGLTDRVDALGGTIEMTSPVGDGTTLLITLPIEEG